MDDSFFAGKLLLEPAAVGSRLYVENGCAAGPGPTLVERAREGTVRESRAKKEYNNAQQDGYRPVHLGEKRQVQEHTM